MKTVKLGFFAISFLLVSCSTDDSISIEYEGLWKLSSIGIFNYSADNALTNEFGLNTMVDENCLTNSTLDLKVDNTAILSLTSILSSNFEIVEGTENELEEIINCENIEEIKHLTWVVGNYEVTNPDGSTTMVSSGPNTLRLFEQNGSVLFTGLIVNDKLNINSGSDNFINAEVEGNIVAFSNLKNLHFYK